ncbi:MAG: PIN domain-containing protein [Coriobacteriales bacterium]|jgi:predicted nucleic acid-binding protein|nr:PIN domain-containing protein [Coriobacteriales bacterium]
MYLVDTSVMIDVLNEVDNSQTALFHRIEQYSLPYGISEYSYLELLQGVRSDKAFAELKEALSTIRIYGLTEGLLSLECAANLYRRCRQAGFTPRSTIDLLIAQVAIDNHLELLHNDRDFDAIAACVDELMIVTV